MNTIIKETVRLLKVSLINSFNLNKLRVGKNKNTKTILTFVGFLLLAIIILPMVFLMAFGMAVALEMQGQLELLVLFAVIAASLSACFVSIYKSPGFLFNFKDFDMLMAFPVNIRSVLMSKIAMLYLSNSFVALIFSVPMLIMYGIFAGSGILFYLMGLVLLLLAPILPMLLGSLFAFVLGRISARFRATNIIFILGSFILIILLIGGSYYLQYSSPELMATSLVEIGQLARVYFMADWFTNSLVNQSLLPFLGFVIVSLVVLALFVMIFANFFKTINGSMAERYSAANYKMKALKVSNQLMALYKKELRLYFSSYIYVLNTAIGMVLLTVYTFALALMGANQIGQLLEMPELNQMIGPISTITFAFCIALTCTTSPSISLEGNSLWIPKSLPIEFKTIMQSKILVNLTIIMPLLLINSIVFAIIYQFSIIDYILFILPLLLLAVSTSCIGIMANLLWPKLNWKSQIQVVKQSASVMLAMLINVVILFIMIVIFAGFTLLNVPVPMLIVAVCLLALISGTWLLILSKGRKLFQAL